MRNKIYIIRANKKNFGGAEIYLDRLAQELSNENISHTIINSNIPKFFFSWIRAFLFNLKICLSKKDKFYFSLDRITCPDIYRAGDGVHKKYIDITKQNSSKFLNLTYCIIEKRAFKNAKHIIAISNMVKNDIIETYNIEAEKISVVYNGINSNPFDYITSFNKLNYEFMLYPTDKIILFIGSGYKRKGVEEFLTIISKIKHPNIKAFVIGKEKKLSYYQNFAQYLNISNKVIFTGPRSDVNDFYTIADIFLFPTFYEPFGNVILEAMNFKNVVITTRQCGGGELLQEEDLMQFPSDYTIVERIEFLLNNPIEMQKTKEVYFVKSQSFTMQKNAHKTIEIISKYYHNELVLAN